MTWYIRSNPTLHAEFIYSKAGGEFSNWWSLEWSSITTTIYTYPSPWAVTNDVNARLGGYLRYIPWLHHRLCFIATCMLSTSSKVLNYTDTQGSSRVQAPQIFCLTTYTTRGLLFDLVQAWDVHLPRAKTLAIGRFPRVLHDNKASGDCRPLSPLTGHLVSAIE